MVQNQESISALHQDGNFSRPTKMHQTSLDDGTKDFGMTLDRSFCGTFLRDSDHAYTQPPLLAYRTSITHTIQIGHTDGLLADRAQFTPELVADIDQHTSYDGSLLSSVVAGAAEAGSATLRDDTSPQSHTVISSSPTPKISDKIFQQPEDIADLDFASSPPKSHQLLSCNHELRQNPGSKLLHDDDQTLGPSSPPTSSPSQFFFSSSLPSSQSSICDNIEPSPLIEEVDGSESPSLRKYRRENKSVPVSSHSKSNVFLMPNTQITSLILDTCTQLYDSDRPLSQNIHDSNKHVSSTSATSTESPDMYDPEIPQLTACNSTLVPRYQSSTERKSASDSSVHSSPIQPPFGFLTYDTKQLNVDDLGNCSSPHNDHETPSRTTPSNADSNHKEPGLEPSLTTIPDPTLQDIKYPNLMHIQAPIFDFESGSLLGKRKTQDDNPTRDGALDLETLKGAHPHGIRGGQITNESIMPNPKRSTLAAQKLQRKKLTTPFRSPVISNSEPILRNSYSLASLIPPPGNEEQVPTKLTTPFTCMQATKDTNKKHRTERAAAPFKSPLNVDALKHNSLIRMTPEIQALERRLQLLRRAVRVQQDGDKETLRKLIRKWTEAGREVAWEVWALVKEHDGSESQSRTNQALRPGGWDEQDFEKGYRCDGNERNWGWNIEPSQIMDESTAEGALGDPGDYKASECDDTDTDNDQKRRDTLGTMLIQLGIVPETLGWDEEEGTFLQDG